MADQASRMKTDWSNWMINPKIFRLINKIWGPFQIDLFANRLNSQLPRYHSWTPDPFAEATNALLQPWSKKKLWANPPWILIPQILAKLIREKATLTIVVPFWKSAPWFPLLIQLLIFPPVVLKPLDLFVQVHPLQPDPLRNPKWNLLVCKIFGHGMKKRFVRENYQPVHISIGYEFFTHDVL